jgi:hypothetical protein
MFCWLFKAVCRQRAMNRLERSALSFLPLRPSLVWNTGLSAIRTITETIAFACCDGSD